MRRRHKTMNIADYWREQSRQRRERCRASGRCIICMTRDARSERVTCERCCRTATEATRRRRRNSRLLSDLRAVLGQAAS